MDLLPSAAEYDEISKDVYHQMLSLRNIIDRDIYSKIASFLSEHKNYPTHNREFFISLLYRLNRYSYDYGIKRLIKKINTFFVNRGYIYYYFDFVRRDSIVGQYADRPKISKRRTQGYPEVTPEIFESYPGISFTDSANFNRVLNKGYLLDLRDKEIQLPRGENYPQIWRSDEMAMQIFAEAKRRNLLTVEEFVLPGNDNSIVIKKYISPRIFPEIPSNVETLRVRYYDEHTGRFSLYEKEHYINGELIDRNLVSSTNYNSGLIRLMYRKIFETPIYVDWSKLCPHKLLDFSSLKAVAESEFGMKMETVNKMTYSELCSYLTNESTKRRNLQQRIAYEAKSRAVEIIEQPGSRWVIPESRGFAPGTMHERSAPQILSEIYDRIEKLCDDPEKEKDELMAVIDIMGIPGEESFDPDKLSNEEICQYIKNYIKLSIGNR